MGKIMIVNGSPRAPKSNSRRYAEIFARHCKSECDYFNISRSNHDELCSKISGYTDLLIVFPLYADSIPATLLDFLKSMEAYHLENKPVISILVNCGFLEPEQNRTVIRMMKLFCDKNGFKTGSVLSLGSGEAILDTPFRSVASRLVRKLANSISSGQYRDLQGTMPMTKKLFLWASTRYWSAYGKKNGITPEAMRTMEIEGN